MNRKTLLFLFLFWTLGLLHGQGAGPLFDTDLPHKADREFQFLAFYINQGVTSNFFLSTSGGRSSA